MRTATTSSVAPDVAARLLNEGFAGLLVGTSLLRTSSLGAWLDTLDGWRHTGVNVDDKTLM